MSEVTVIYIAGYGRSGSTLLDTLLDRHPNIGGCGELRWLFHHAANQTPCSNEHALTECPTWKAPLAATSNDWTAHAALTDATESAMRKEFDEDAYKEVWGAALHALAKESGNQFVVDSSKTCHNAFYRAVLFSQIPGVQVKLVHLIRDPRAVMWSLMRVVDRQNRKLAWVQKQGKITKGLASWTWANRAVPRILEAAPDIEHHRLYYQDLVSDSQQTFSALGRFIGLDLHTVIPQDPATIPEPGCAVGGNRMRKSSDLTLKADTEWETNLPGYPRMLYALNRSSTRPWEKPAS